MAKYIQVQTFKFMSQTLLLLLAKTLETLYCGTSLETNDTSFNTFVSHIKPNLKKNIGMPRYATLKKKQYPHTGRFLVQISSPPVCLKLIGYLDIM